MREWSLMTENHFRSNFRSIHNFNFLEIISQNDPPAAILDDRKSLSIAFLPISDKYATLNFLDFFTKWLPAAIISRHFRYATFFFIFFSKWFWFLRLSPKSIGFFQSRSSMAVSNMNLAPDQNHNIPEISGYNNVGDIIMTHFFTNENFSGHVFRLNVSRILKWFACLD